MARTSPTVRRRRLAAALKRLRQEAQRTREQVAEYVGCSPPTITRIENAQSGARIAEVARMLEFYGVPEDEQEPLLQVAREARQRGWWQRYSSALPDWFPVYVGLEAEAATVHGYDVDLIPGLFQTAEYSRAQMDASPTQLPEDEINRRLEVRARRQEEVLNTEAPPQIWAIINEAALRRRVRTADDRDVMPDQIRKLKELAQRPNVTVQVLTFDAGAHASPQSAFTILGFEVDPDVVYIEFRTGALYVEELPEVETYTVMFDHLRAAALSPTKSLAVLTRLAKSDS